MPNMVVCTERCLAPRPCVFASQMLGQAQTGYEFSEKFAIFQILAGFFSRVVGDSVMHARHYHNAVAPDPQVSSQHTDRGIG